MSFDSMIEQRYYIQRSSASNRQAGGVNSALLEAKSRPGGTGCLMLDKLKELIVEFFQSSIINFNILRPNELTKT